MTKLEKKKEKKLRKSKNILNVKLKRIFDIVISLLALVLFSPIFIYLSFRIKKEDRGPIFFRQKRAGLDGETFSIFKFRSMSSQSISKVSSGKTTIYDKWEGKVPDDFIFKSVKSSDSNVTEIGKFIRRYSLDELPQFLNVLLGQMSIVGPRPEIIEITKHYDSYQEQRLNVKPGITGWAQVNGRSNMNHGEKIKYDLWYVNHNNFLLDLRIIALTAAYVLIGKDSV